MLKWYKENERYLGFEDDTLLYLVYNEGNGFGWEWEYVPDMDGFDGYETAEEAIASNASIWPKWVNSIRP